MEAKVRYKKKVSSPKKKGCGKDYKKKLRKFVFFLFLSPLKKKGKLKKMRGKKKSPLFQQNQKINSFHPI